MKKRSKLMLACLIWSIIYACILGYFLYDITNQASQKSSEYQLGAMIALKLLETHIIFVALGTITTIIAFIVKNKWAALASWIMFIIAFLQAPITYAIFLIPQIILIIVYFILDIKKENQKVTVSNSDNKSIKKNVKSTGKNKISTLNIVLIIFAIIFLSITGALIYAVTNENAEVPVITPLLNKLKNHSTSLDELKKEFGVINSITDIKEDKQNSIIIYEIKDSDIKDEVAATIYVMEDVKSAKKFFADAKNVSKYASNNMVITISNKLSNDAKNQYKYVFDHITN